MPTDVSVVVATLDGLPWLERCLESVRGHHMVVVDVGSTDGSVELIQTRFPEAELLEIENRGVAAAWNAGIRRASARYVLLLNSDAWLIDDALGRITGFADAHPEAALVGPRLRNLDGSVQRSVRGFPTLWRLTTEYFFLRKLAPRSRLLNAFYAGGFEHDMVREAEFVMGACMLVRREAIDAVGLLDEDFFIFSEETDWQYRFAKAGWRVFFFPGAEVVHVGGATHGGRFFREQVKGHLRFLAKHRGMAEAERARRLLVTALRLRGLAFSSERGQMYGETARWLAAGTTATLLAQPADRDRGDGGVYLH